MSEQSASLQGISHFLKSLKSFEDNQNSSRLKSLREGFSKLMAGLAAIERDCADSDRVQSPRFNLFELIQVERNEKWTHSAFLSDLFNPRGCHGQRSLFLSYLLEWVKEKANMQLPDGLAETPWEVETEKWTSNGFIDICIESFDSDFIIVMENKVDAAEQPDQIYRYHQWASKRCKHPVVIYLTLNGKEASTSREAPYVRMSYRDDMSGLLASAQGEIESAAVREVVGQCVSIIRKLGGVHPMSDYDRRVVEYLAESENLPYALDVAERIEAVKEEVLRVFFSKLKDRLAELLAKSEHAGDWTIAAREDDQPGSLQIVFQKGKWDPKSRSIYFGVDYEDGLFAGLSCESLTVEEQNFIRNCKSTKEALAQIAKHQHKYEPATPSWPVSRYIEVRNERTFQNHTYRYISSNPRATHDAADRVWDFFNACRSGLDNLNGELLQRKQVRNAK